ncbi:hypothetical protein T492DRAFT_1070960 [Pavlovales sp. CCMP2436]|nr:hypothetical protein T492DRAFT_1070960 [Pavlovales sp. CCMP2436]
MIIDTEELDQLRCSYSNSPELVSLASGPARALPSAAAATQSSPGICVGTAPATVFGSDAPLEHSSAQSGTPDTFTKLDTVKLSRNDSTPSLMSQQLSAWSVKAPPQSRPVEQTPSHRRCRSEGVFVQKIKLLILLPPSPGSASSTADTTVPISVPAFYTVQQTIVTALHECRRRLPSACWRDLEGAQLVLRITEDGEPEFDLPALAATALVSSVGETELALCAKSDHGPWRAELSNTELDELRGMMRENEEAEVKLRQAEDGGGGCSVS